MFNLVLFVISVALSVALAVAGTLLIAPPGARAPMAAEVDVHYNEAMRITEALQMWRWSHFGADPANVAELASAGYLSTNASTGWELQDGVLKVSLADATLCKALNRRLGQQSASVPACSAVAEAERGVCCS